MGSETSERTEFIYLLRWPDEDAKTPARAAFLADREWAEIKQAAPEPLVGDVEDRSLVMTRHSPAFV